MIIKPLDLGGGRSFRFTKAYGSEDIVGGIESHPRPDSDEPCEGFVHFDVPANASETGPKWTVTSWDPLTLEPSLLCRVCGNHGFIRNGEWVPA